VKKEIDNPKLKSWVALNDFLIKADEEQCAKLFEEESKGRNRKAFLKRIHSRLNRVRALNERKQIESRS
jgi:hypothetical protein